MKRAITILLALLMVLSLAACGGGGNGKDKEKLIGTWKKITPYSVSEFGSQGGFKGRFSMEGEETYSFYKNNEFYNLWYMGIDALYGERIPRDQWEKRLYHGTYKIKDGFITLTYDDNDMGEEIIPYHINEYTKKLIFDVNEKGESDWEKKSDTPKELSLD